MTRFVQRMSAVNVGRRTLGILLAVVFLLGGGTVTAQIIEHYHLDTIGNVRVVTDAGGNIIERHDYLASAWSVIDKALPAVRLIERGPFQR